MSKFSKYLESTKEILKELVDTLSKEYEFVSILGSDCNGKTYRKMKGNTNIGDNMYKERGFVLRIYNGNNYAEYSFNEINKDLISTIVKKVKDNLMLNSMFSESKQIEIKKYGLLKEEELVADFERDSNKIELTQNEILDKLDELLNMQLEGENVVNAYALCQNLDISKIYISNKRFLTQFYTWTCWMAMPIVVNEKGSNSFYEAQSGVNAIEVFEKLKKNIPNAIENANGVLNSEPPTPGVYEVITAPDITGLIAHEAFGHGVEMDMFVKGRALGEKFVGKRVASDMTNMHEAAKGNEEVSSYFFDDEGTLAHDTVEIKNGILQTGVCDAISALILGIEPTGNGKRESFERKAYTRMTSTYFEAGNDKLEDMIKSIKKGYLITGMHSGMEDPKNWGIQCAAAMGKEIIDGKFTGKVVSPVMMTGYVPDLLGSISMATDTVELFGSGSCGKGYKEWVKTADGGPYLKVKVNIG